MFKTLFETRLPSSSCAQAAFVPGRDLPAGMDVRFGVDDEHPDLLIHEYRDDVLRVVNAFYAADSSSPVVNAGQHHQSLLDQYLEFLMPVLERQGSKTLALLEVGCGEGRVVHALAQAGYVDVTACEAASFPFHERLTGVRLVREYVRPGLFQGKVFDVVFSKTVFEHIPRLHAVLAEMRELLKPGGRMFFSVPNCETEIALGDPRMLALHHWNYFTPKSVASTVADAGYELIRIESKRGDLFVTCAVAGGRPAPRAGEVDPSLVAYAGAFRKNLARLQARIDALKAIRGSVALYGLDYNFSFMLDWSGVTSRVVDSDRTKWGLLYRNDPAATIGSPETLLAEPVSEVWITPLTYDAEIRQFLKGHLRGTTTKVVSLKELYEEEGADPTHV
jgi:SAM-dependent methyltransferase